MLAQHKNNFDFLRFLAASVVLFSHMYAITGLGGMEPILRLTGVEPASGFAVYLFFVISGFLVAGSLERNHNFFAFFKRRALRLFPGLIGVIFFSIFIIGILFTTLRTEDYLSHAKTWGYLRNILLLTEYELPGVFANNLYPGAVNGSLWTLPTEFLMYFLLPCFAFVLGRLKLWKALVYAAFIVFYIRTEVNLELAGKMFFNFTSYGMIAKLGSYFFAGTFWHGLQKYDIWRFDLFILACALLVSSFHTPNGHILMALTWPYIGLFLAFADLGPLSSFGRYGDFSYGIYLYAFPVQQALASFFWPKLGFWLNFVLMFFLTLVLAVLSWFFIEKPSLKLKDKSIVASYDWLPFQSLAYFRSCLEQVRIFAKK